MNHQSDSQPDRPISPAWEQTQAVLDALTALSYRSNDLHHYLQQVTLGVSRLLGLDWSVVTLCWEDNEKVLASSLDVEEIDKIYSLHGSLTDTVVRTRKTLAVEDAVTCCDYGEPPEGYRSYLGVPLRIPQGDVIGTLCSFCEAPRQFEQDEIAIAELFAERAATAIDNYNLYQYQQKFNEMLETELVKRTTELRATQAKLIEQERLAAIGEFTSMIVHEIRNPLTTMTMGLKYFQKLHGTGLENERANLALEEAHRLHNLLNEVLLYAKPQVLHLSQLDLNALLQGMQLPLTEMPEACDRHLALNLPPHPTSVLGDSDKLKQVFINLIRNAYEAIAPHETVTCCILPSVETGVVKIQVHNGGAPIPAEILPKLTQPFCSTKSSGSGLGLAIVKRIVEAHNGSLSIQSTAATGTLIQIDLPLVLSSSEY
ncbi:MAG: ATP-binding protein [Synechococcales bacterium]|nr:ATP-binding protein [Synechococcales bacterium]